MPLPLVIDTDIGDDIDDALALALALRSPEVQVLGISTVFGDTVRRARLAQKVLSTFGSPAVAVAPGAALPLAPRRAPSGVAQAAVLGDAEDFPDLYPGAAHELWIECARQAIAAGSFLTLVTIGPLTNVALALKACPQLNKHIARIVCMAGSSLFPWPDWNVRSDPEAARLVFESGIPLTLLPLDLTMRCRLSPRQLERIQHSTAPGTALLAQLIFLWQTSHRRRLPILHDPLTVATAAGIAPVSTRTRHLFLPLRGPLRGFTLPRLSTSGPAVEIGVKVDALAFTELFLARICPSNWE